MAKHIAKIIMNVQSHMDPPEHIRRQAMAQGIPAPNGVPHCAKQVEFYGEGNTISEAISVVTAALERWLANPGMDVVPVQLDEATKIHGVLSGKTGGGDH